MPSLVEPLERFLEAVTVAQKWRTLRPVERKLQRAMSKAFRSQGDVFLRGFGALRGEFSEALSDALWLAVWDAVAQRTTALFVDPIQEAAAAAMTLGAHSLIATLDVDVAFDLANPRAVSYLEAHGAELVRGIDDTTRDSLRVLLRQAVDEGWGYGRTAKAIRDQFDGFAGLKPQAHIRDRATLVAVTESAMAYEHGNRIVVDDLATSGLRMEHSWLTVGDNRVSDGCRENQRAGWIPTDEPFPSSHSNPPRFPGCRCTTLYRRKPD